jgi:hypothetical protein
MPGPGRVRREAHSANAGIAERFDLLSWLAEPKTDDAAKLSGYKVEFYYDVSWVAGFDGRVPLWEPAPGLIEKETFVRYGPRCFGPADSVLSLKPCVPIWLQRRRRLFRTRGSDHESLHMD